MVAIVIWPRSYELSNTNLMSRTKDYFHDEIEEQSRRQLMEEPENLPDNQYKFAISVSVDSLSEVYTVLALIYQSIKKGHDEDGETFKKDNGTISSYGFRRL